jgi:N-ethylmaleimide reductase
MTIIHRAFLHNTCLPHSLNNNYQLNLYRRCTPTEDPHDQRNAVPNDILVEYYGQRASAGLVITEATAISEAGCGWLYAAHIRTPDQVAGWKRVTDRVHAEGSVIYLQLWHMGRQSHSSYHPSTGKIFAPSAIPVTSAQARTITGENVPYETPSAMTIEEIKETVQDFVTASKLAAEAGFDGVEVHGANGYLLDEFVQSSTNHRTDEYGGSMENRARFSEEVIQAIIDSGAFPANRIGYRVSPNGNYGEMGSEDNDKIFPFLAERLSKYGLAYLHVMDGVGFGYHEKCPIVTVYDLKTKFQGLVICNIGLTKESGEGMLRSGAADLAAYGRLYISNPDLPLRFEKDLPLAESAPYETWWYNTGEKGYTDWAYAEVPAEETKE